MSPEQKIDLLLGDIFHFCLKMGEDFIAALEVEILHKFFSEGYLFLFKGEGDGTVQRHHCAVCELTAVFYPLLVDTFGLEND